MQYLTLIKSLKKLHTLKKLKYSQSLTSPALSLWKFHFRGNYRSSDPIQSNPCNSSHKSTQSNPIQSNPWMNPIRVQLWAVWTLRQTDGGAQSRRRPQSFFNYLRMEPAMFDELVQRVGPRIEKQDTNMRKALPRQAWSWLSQWGFPFRFSLEWHQNVNAAPQLIYAGCISVFLFWNLAT